MEPHIPVVILLLSLAVFLCQIALFQESFKTVAIQKRKTTVYNSTLSCMQEMKDGSYYPKDPARKLVLIIPFRDESETHFRSNHLHLMLHYTIGYMIKQNTQFTVLVVNQASGKAFNRAKLLNVGFAYANQQGMDTDCYVFHDVDLIGESADFVYYCDKKTPLHLSAWRQNQNYTPKHKNIMGGVTTFTRKQFTEINGYSNSYWGWGAEDDDLSNRVRTFYKRKTVPRPENKTSYHIYQISHDRDEGNEKNSKRVEILKKWKSRWHDDGINVSQLSFFNLAD